MKIYFDDIIFELQKAGGISKYWAKLCSNFSNLSLINLEGKEAYKNVFYPKDIKVIESDSKFPLGIRRYLPILRRINCDIYHSSYYRIPFLINKNAKQIVTVHDFMYEFFDTGIKKKIHIWQKRKAMLNADAIICVSEHTKKDLQLLYPEINKDILYVVPNGVDEDFIQLKEKKKVIKIGAMQFNQNLFLLYVGTRMGCKNFNFIFDLIEKSKLIKDKNLKLVCIGGGEFTKEEKEKFNNLNYSHNVININNVDNYVLNDLYNSAYALLFPSLYEGFGIPALEAQKSGCPVIYAKTSSLPEVVVYTELGYTLNNIEEAENTLNLLENNEIRSELISRGVEHASRLSWKNTAQMTLDVYKKVMDS